MMHDPWVDRLSEYLDDELSAVERRELDAHLATCAECRSILGELREVVSVAATAPDAPPARDLWAGIAARIGETAPQVVQLERRRSQRISFTLWQLAAAAAVMMTVGGSAVWLALQTEREGAVPVAQQQGQSPAQLVSTEYSGHEQAITDLETALEENRAQLDTATVRVLLQSLTTIDHAIADARAALEQDPANPFLHRHLDGAMRKKIEILRRAVSVRRAQT